MTAQITFFYARRSLTFVEGTQTLFFQRKFCGNGPNAYILTAEYVYHDEESARWYVLSSRLQILKSDSKQMYTCAGSTSYFSSYLEHVYDQ
mmetsp:Transcript_24528/g.43039  ORF Transcript_24528/g.43039 Transcript_24528/m.43039 type:complete len:91 (+) Transcript_24528:35-307(+)